MVKESKAESGLKNPLSDKRILVKYIMKHKAGVTNKNHLIYGGKLDIATDKFYVMLNGRTGVVFDPFTIDEREFVAAKLGIEPIRLSPNYTGEDNFWNTYFVSLGKSGDILDMREVTDFIKYKVLLTNKGLIAPSPEDINKKPSYRYYLVDKNAEVDAGSDTLDAKKTAYMNYGKIEGDKFKLAYVVWRMARKSVSSKTQAKTLKAQLNSLIETKTAEFNKLTSDKLFDRKALINQGVMLGVVTRKDNEYYMEKEPLSSGKAAANLQNAAAFLDDPVNQDKLFLLQERINTSLE